MSEICEPGTLSPVAVIEHLLERAWDGEIEAVAVAVVTKDDCAQQTWSAPSGLLKESVRLLLWDMEKT